jgi:hypothetical protein
MEEVTFQKTNLVRVLPTEMIEQGLREFGFPPRDIQSLFGHTGFPVIPFKSTQLYDFGEVHEGRESKGKLPF